MSKLQDILDVENSRQENNDFTTIHLWKDGSFYRMYNQSAWLVISRCYNETLIKDDYKPLVVTRKRIPNTEDTMCFIGFPLKSLQKFIPNATGFNPTDDVHIQIPINLTEEIDFATFDNQYQAWFNLLPIKEEKPKKTFEKKEQPVQQSSVVSIATRILRYPLEQRSLIENTQFLSSIKHELATIF